MQIALDAEVASLPPNCFACVHVGKEYRLFPLKSSQSLSFLDVGDRSKGRVEIFQRFGDCHFDLKGGVQHVRVDCADSRWQDRQELPLRITVPEAEQISAKNQKLSGKSKSWSRSSPELPKLPEFPKATAGGAPQIVHNTANQSNSSLAVSGASSLGSHSALPSVSHHNSSSFASRTAASGFGAGFAATKPQSPDPMVASTKLRKLPEPMPIPGKSQTQKMVPLPLENSNAPPVMQNVTSTNWNESRSNWNESPGGLLGPSAAGGPTSDQIQKTAAALGATTRSPWWTGLSQRRRTTALHVAGQVVLE
eukprot:gnl/MRDRNA2_/MRDRNA2_175769_c0_seq1.p1 gnl/MRDRNA2_/MRDRNA2_175769_c0~~gnl/MRDRNA2_/MRDRNA2_175769_c0_seq1.p1  ORF type:complete len:308 (-),score=45.35 gnl/MRDRNA2_/MRDRNA2_175769_c0_seq1:101-1024(-)